MRYLESDAEIEDRGAIEGRVASLNRQIGEREALEREARERETRQPVEPVEPESDAPERQASLVPWLVVSAGAVVAAVGVALVPVAQSRHDDAVDEPEHLRAFELQDQSKRLNRTGLTMLATGAVIATLGVVWAIVELGDDTEVALGPGSAMVRGRF